MNSTGADPLPLSCLGLVKKLSAFGSHLQKSGVLSL